MKKNILILTLFVVFSLVMTACAGAEETEAPGVAMEGLPDLEGRVVTVAIEDAYPPFNYVDEETGDSIGWDYDVVREICNRINCVPEFTLAAWDGIFPAMAAGEYDWLADGVTVKAERDEIIDFSIPYVVIGQVLLVRADETGTLEDIQADTSRLVATQIGTTNEFVAKTYFPDAQISSFEDFPAAILALLSKDADAVVIDTVSATGFMDANEGQLKIATQLTSDEELAFVFPPGSDLIEAVNAALESMMDDGKLDEYNKKWKLTP